MNRYLMRALMGAFAVVAAPEVVSAQLPTEWFGPRMLSLQLDVGGAAFSDFRRSQGRLVTPSAGRTDFDRRVSARTSMGVGGSATYWFRRDLGIRASGAYVPTRFSVWNDESAERMMDVDPLDEEASAAALGAWLGSVTVAFRFPHSFGRVMPYGLVGAGAVHYRLRDGNELPPEARGPFQNGSHTSPAGVFGVGAVIPLQWDGLLLNFELTNHLARTPLRDGAYGEEFEMGEVPVQLAPRGESGESGEIGLTSNLRLTLGITLSLVRR